MSKEFDISEINKLCKEIEKKGKNIRKGIKSGVTKTANQCQSIAKRLAPVGETGDLRLSIGRKVSEDGTKVEAEVSPSVEYSVYVEMGTGQRGMASNIERPEGVQYKADWKGQDAQPYMYPAYVKSRENLVPNIKKELNKVLERG